MEGVYLRIFTTERHQHNGVLLYEWLLEQAKALGIHGGSAFRAIAGFGRHGRMHEDTFIELTPELPVEVVFMLSDAETTRLLDFLEAQQLSLFYVKTRAEYGSIGDA